MFALLLVIDLVFVAAIQYLSGIVRLTEFWLHFFAYTLCCIWWYILVLCLRQ